MPAVEQTYRDTKWMHKIFGASSFIMLIATIWMFAADHAREWKPIQRTSDNIDIRMTAWRKYQFERDEAERGRAEIKAQLDEARRKPIPANLLTEFEAEVHSQPRTQNVSFERIKERAAEIEANAGTPEAEASRDDVLKRLRKIVADAKFTEVKLLGDRKFKSADRDAEVAELGLFVRDGKSAEDQRVKQGEIDRITAELNQLTMDYQLAKDHRVKLDRILKEITKDEDSKAEALAKSESDVVQLDAAIGQKTSTYVNWVGFVPLPGKRILELPILDAFNSPRKIENLWSKGLDIDYNFAKVRRFDRCTTCHQAMQKTMPGSAVDAAFGDESLLDFHITLEQPEGVEGAQPAADANSAATASAAAATPAVQEPSSPAKQLEDRLGVRIATEGLVNRYDATIQFIRPNSPASMARAPLNSEAAKLPGEEIRKMLMVAKGHDAIGQVRPGMLAGDVIVGINGEPIPEPNKVIAYLLDIVERGKNFTVTIRRGLPNPFTTHPRLDLFVGSMSPHKMAEFACTVCHEGQGSATAFKFASHTPNDEQQRKQWVYEHGWFDNTHWPFPMYPERFAESACLKCHHMVTELEATPQFSEAPAPKVTHGYHLIRKFGCFGCHEINGYDGKKRIGPDLRLEPNFFAAALQLQNDPGFSKLSPEEQAWVQDVIDSPDQETARHRVLEAMERDAASKEPRLSQISLTKLTPLFRDIESPGTMRKPGPSLRYVGSKNDAGFLYDWIREPKHFRPTTRMPQFFGLNKHLEGTGGEAPSPGLEDSKRFEPIEILGLTTYLLARTQKFEYLEAPEGITEAADVARGKTTFQTRGCLACHQHKNFADAEPYRGPIEIVQGPDLSSVGEKFVGENGRKWLYSWIKQPSRYHARTLMPDLFLDPIQSKGADNSDVASDPVADIVEFLLSDSKTGWKPTPGTLAKPADADEKNLDDFVELNLAETFSSYRVSDFRKKGIPESMRGELKGAEIELLVPDDQRSGAGFELTAEQKLIYIGSRTISKFGCYGCHDIPGFEDARPIGTVLADWGRKDPARLAFEHITHYIEHGHGHGHSEREVESPGHGGFPGQPAAGPASPAESGIPNPTENKGRDSAQDTERQPDQGHAVESGHAAFEDDASPEVKEYFTAQLKSGNRIGFLYQKLLEPRSYDYHKTENKKYGERLRMPQFPFGADEREAVMTFILGLVADPPNDKYIYQPTARTQAWLAGREVLEKYNCAGCHILTPETWNVVHTPSQFGEQAAVKTYPFVFSHFPTQVLDESAKLDRSGLLRSTLQGMPSVDDLGMPIAYDDVGEPLEAEGQYELGKLELPLELWRPAALAGKPFEVGVLPLNIPTGAIERRTNSDGGFLIKYLLPHVVAIEKQANPAAKGTEAWGWLPPPLINEGQKVQTDWLHSFLLNPYPIRPATFLRMPRFNMSAEEATLLVNYFAAVDNAEYPYAFSSRRQPEHLSRADAQYQQTLQAAGGAAPTNQPAPADRPAPGNRSAPGNAATPGDQAAPADQPANGNQPAPSEEEERSRLNDAMRIVVNTNYCVKCHIVGDFSPKGSDRAKAPNLALVYRRLRPDYMRKWIANPKTYLPYTSMPVNIPYDPTLPNQGGVAQDLFHGTSAEQVDGLVDLLMNFDEYAKQRNSVTDFVEKYGGQPLTETPPTETPVPASGTSPATGASTDNAGGDRN